MCVCVCVLARCAAFAACRRLSSGDDATGGGLAGWLGWAVTVCTWYGGWVGGGG